MVTKEQALVEKQFTFVDGSKWRKNGKCKTWKRKPDHFKLPIKHGLYSYGYITHENCHLFNLAD